ncbi:MAG: hypothetical protein WC592_06400 [Candidatus Omnitrophota bacterium]
MKYSHVLEYSAKEAKEKIRKASDAVTVFFDFFRSEEIKSDYSKVFSEIRYVVLEIYVVMEFLIDRIILKRYCNTCSEDARQSITIDVLSSIDFARKIRIIKKIRKCCEAVNIKKLQYFNNLRNGLVHNFPAHDSCFIFHRGHIIYDGAIKYLFKDVLKIIKDLKEVEAKIVYIEDSSYFKIVRSALRSGTNNKPHTKL